MLSVRKVFILAIGCFFLSSCHLTDGVIYCIEFIPTDATFTKNLIQDQTFDVERLKVNAIYGDNTQKEIFNGGNTWDASEETIFIDFTHSDDARMRVKYLQFQLPSGEILNFDLEVNTDYDDNGLVDYDLIKGQQLICTSCQKGVKEIAFSN